MKERERSYLAIDLKSFYASVECVERGLDPLKTNLVVADVSRTEKTICLAVSPALKAYGISGRARLFEVIAQVRRVNEERARRAPGGKLTGSSVDDEQLKASPELALDYITAVPRMAYYMEYSTRIYQIYLKHLAPEDIHVYSIDEILCDVTTYLAAQHLTPRQLAARMIRDVYETTGITAAAGIGTNLYLCKVAMDIVAKHVVPDEEGMRIAELDEMGYRKLLWCHQPLTDFWRVGRGYAKKLAEHGMYTMGDIARCSIGKPTDYHNEDLLYRLFGINAELLIDHAWGWEPCTIAEIKAYRPSSSSLGSGQVLTCPYDAAQARIVVREMTELLVLDLVEKDLVTDQMVLTVGYDIENLEGDRKGHRYRGEVTTDHFGRQIPKHAHGTTNLKEPTSSTRKITQAVLELYDQIVDQDLLVRRLQVTANKVVQEEGQEEADYQQLELFTDYEAICREKEVEASELEKEKKLQLAMLDIKKKFGKNAILKGTNLQEGATARDKNRQIGGHKA